MHDPDWVTPRPAIVVCAQPAELSLIGLIFPVLLSETRQKRGKMQLILLPPPPIGNFLLCSTCTLTKEPITGFPRCHSHGGTIGLRMRKPCATGNDYSTITALGIPHPSGGRSSLVSSTIFIRRTRTHARACAQRLIGWGSTRVVSIFTAFYAFSDMYYGKAGDWFHKTCE